jgi:hypothetical protein
LEKTWKGFFFGAAAIGAAGLWSAAAKRLWAIIAAPVAIKMLAAIGRIVTSLRAFEFVSEALVGVADTIVKLIAAVGALAAAVPIAPTVAAVALTGGAAFLIRRSWSSVLETIRKLISAISAEALAIITDLTSAIGLGLKNDSPGQLAPAGNATSRERTSRGLRAFASAAFISSAANLLIAAPPSLRTIEPSQIWDGFQAGCLSARRVVATAILTAPILVAPTMVNASSDQTIARASSTPMVFNSTPTIVINAGQLGDIEHRIAEALRQHREAIFVEWSRELQRRQRTEF